MDSYLNQPLKKYLDDVSARLPAPGGGSVSAAVGALGAALFCMVENFTTGEKYKQVEKEISEILEQTEKIRQKLNELIQEDVLAYGKLSGAYKLPKNTEEEKKIRTEAIQQACKQALEVPMEIAEACVGVLQLGKKLLELGNPNLISDVGVGAVLLEAALNGAALNVEINLAVIKDKDFVESKKAALDKLLSGTKELKDEILNKTKSRL